MVQYRSYAPGHLTACTVDIYPTNRVYLKLVWMSRPPVQAVTEFRATVPCLTMRKTSKSKTFPTSLGKAAGGLLLLAGLTFLVGCQGVSAGGSSNPQTTLNLGSGSLDFGSVAAGSSKTMTVTAVNSGPASVTISSAAISTKYFSLTSPNLPISIAAGLSVPVSITFKPNAAGNFTASVAVTSDASNS